MSSTSLVVDNIYEDAKDFLIIGMTGRTGSGCTTAAKILCEKRLDIPSEGYEGLTRNEFKKHKIIKKYIDGGSWTPFYRIEASSLITYHLLLLSDSEFCDYISCFDFAVPLTDVEVAGFSSTLNEARTRVLSVDAARYSSGYEDVSLHFELYFTEMPNVTSLFMGFLGRARFTQVYQQAGDNVRSSGAANSSDFVAAEIFNFPKHLNILIKLAHKKARSDKVPCRIVIDAIRNPYEAFFLKRRYANFYLVSINTSNFERLNSLRGYRKLSDHEIKILDDKEYPEKISGMKKFVAQNVQECIEISDIHIYNSKSSEFTHNDLVSQLAWYVTLMMHPGLVMPTSIESCMQIAYTAKQSSGCISRQVGAVVTDESYSVKAIGWNNTPQGQTPCMLRSAEDLLEGRNKTDYSEYELKSEVFRNAISAKYSQLIATNKESNRNFSFCFKSVQNEIEGEKNQVHTRALHAEENAFLQIAKHGGQKLSGGVLFTTASPCELCAKKAYQLGLKKIVYIDPYPGIATQHILSSGQNKPELELFKGAVGRAFYQLYQPLMPYKDELELAFDIPSYHNSHKPSKAILNERNIELERMNKLLMAELEVLRSAVAEAKT
ncbi:deaminase [Pseudomonas orientalis]|uniref:deaminase n=1 Tax=Pseudomonas orientalis TaxID=76758 RepID=UPI0030DD7B11